MKRRVGWLALVVFGFCVWPPGVEAQLPKDYFDGGDPPFASQADSVTATLLNGASDTTGWIDLRNFRLQDCVFAGQPLVKAVVNTNAVTGDTMGVVLQFSDDKTVLNAKTKVNLIGASPQRHVIITCDTDANDAAYGYRYIRLIYSDDDVTRTAGYTNFNVTLAFLTAR